MATPTNLTPTSEPSNRKGWRRWLPWGVVGVIVLGPTVPTILMPAADRIYFAVEERQLNEEFRRNGINGRASFQGRLFEGTLYISAENLDDSKVAPLANILKEQQRIQITDSDVSWDGLQHLVGCKRLMYVMFADTNISDPDLRRLQDAMPKSRISAKWRGSDRFFQGKP